MIRMLLSVLSPGGARGRLSILILHRVLARPDPLLPGEVDVAEFDRMCGWVSQWFRVLALDEAAALLRDGRLPPRALAITFDDGYADNHDVALPILVRHGLKATFFIATGFIDGGRMWNDTVIESVRSVRDTGLDLTDLDVPGLGRVATADIDQRRAAIDAILRGIKYRPARERLALSDRIAERCGAAPPADLMMRSDQVRALHRAGMQVGAHTVTHPILAGLPRATARAEIESSRDALRAITGDGIRLFAYPNGVPGRDFDDETVSLVDELGFECAVTTGWGAARSTTDRLRLPRFSPWDRTRMRFGWRMAGNLLRP